MKKLTEKISIFKNIPLLLIGTDIDFINNKAKKLLSYNKKTHQEIYDKIISAIKNKIFQIETKTGNTLKSIYIQHESVYINKKKYYLCILSESPKQSVSISELHQKIRLYEEMFDNLPIGILIHDNGKTKYINKHGMKILEAKSQKQYLDFFILDFLLSEKDKSRAIKRMKSTDNYLPPEIYEIQSFKKNKKIVELYSYLFPFYKEKEKDIVRLIVFTDKTTEIEKQKIEVEAQIKQHENKLLKKQNEIKEQLLKEIKIKQEQLFNTVNHSDYLFWILDEKLNILLFNDTFREYCRKYYNINIKVGDNTIYIQNKMNEEEIQTSKLREKLIKELLENPRELEYEINHFDKYYKKGRVFKMKFKPIFDENKKLKNYYCYGHEITEKYEFLNQIEHHTTKLKEIVEHSPIYLWSMNKNQELSLFNENYRQLIEKLYGETPVIGKKLSKGKYAKNKEIVQQLDYHYQKAFNGSHENFKLNFEVNEFKKITLDVNLFPIIINNEIKEISGIAIDITQEIEKQKQLQELLVENEVLIKEVHHRIKNNLQVISSMINMQIQQEDNPYTKNILRDTQNRIYSMAMIHQTLYQNRNYTSINISNNIPNQIQNILYSFNKTDIEIHSDIEEIILDVNTAIPIALIINEAITNVAKYAFPETFSDNKKLEVVLLRNNRHIELSVKDNGVGIPPGQMNNIISNIGFSIIRALAEQINAQLFITSQSNQGTEIKLLIPQL